VLVVAVAAAFGLPSLFSGAGAVVVAGLTYILLGAVFASVNLPYSALPAVVTTNSSERVALNAWRMIGTNIGGFALGAAGMPLLLAFGGGHLSAGGFLWMAVALAVAAVPLFWITFAGTREVVTTLPAERATLRQMLDAVIGNSQLLITFTSMVLFLTGLLGRMAVVVYYYLYVMGRPDLTALLMMAQSLAGAVGVAVLSRLSRPLGKRRTLVVSFGASAVVLVALFLTPPTTVWLVLVLTVLYGLAGFGTPVAMSMVADCVDWEEDRSGRRNDGVAFSTMSAGPKIAGAVGGALALAVMSATGYRPGGASTATWGINVAANLLPAIFAVASLIPLRKYVISEAVYDEVRARLDSRTGVR
jgi:GPH family glycoside/pentoside/hexuronide:cation symporter/probable glucitol transport protein GutA